MGLGGWEDESSKQQPKGKTGMEKKMDVDFFF